MSKFRSKINSKTNRTRVTLNNRFQINKIKISSKIIKVKLLTLLFKNKNLLIQKSLLIYSIILKILEKDRMHQLLTLSFKFMNNRWLPNNIKNPILQLMILKYIGLFLSYLIVKQQVIYIFAICYR